MSAGKLYLIPNLLGGNDMQIIPNINLQIIHQLKYFIVENAKNARAFLKLCKHPQPMSALIIKELDKHVMNNPHYYLIDILNGIPGGLISDAGCPGIADPGADIIAEAHKKNITVLPLVGPSSILLTLMGSGLNGQQFHFHGYMPIKKEDRIKHIKLLEDRSRREKCTNGRFKNGIKCKNIIMSRHRYKPIKRANPHKDNR